MSSLVALVLIAATVIGVVVFLGWPFNVAEDARVEREEQAQRRARLQLTIARLELGACAFRGHRYHPTATGWLCGGCGDYCESAHDWLPSICNKERTSE